MVVLVAGLLGGMGTLVTQANAGLVLVLIIIGAAYVGGRWAGGATALAAAISFDFFLTEPFRSLAIKSYEDIITTILLFCVGIAVGQIARSRRAARALEQQGVEDIAGIHRVTRLTADGTNLYSVIAAVEHEVAEVLDLASCSFDALAPDPPRPELAPDGHIDAPYVHVGEGFVLPPEGVAIAVRSGGRSLGWLVGEPSAPLVGISRERRRTALVLAEHLGLALTQADAA